MTDCRSTKTSHHMCKKFKNNHLHTTSRKSRVCYAAKYSKDTPLFFVITATCPFHNSTEKQNSYRKWLSPNAIRCRAS